MFAAMITLRNLLLAALSALCLSPAIARADTVGDCHIGAYRLDGGGLVDIGASDGDALRWRRFDGTTGALKKQPDGGWTSTIGWTDHADGKTVRFTPCAEGGIVFDGVAGRRIPLDSTDVTFHSQGVALAGRLVMPKGAGRVPVVVLIHGSEQFSARDFYSLQRILPTQGIGVFVYDKRGTGASGGAYTQDFSLLADDAVAAVGEARRLAGPRAGRVGLQGGSQAGWIEPLAASRTAVDFVVVGFGLAVSPIEEDQAEVALEMALKGHGAADTAKALEVAAAAEALMESRFTRGYEAFDAVRAKYRDAPWYKDLHGNITYLLLPYTAAELREKGKAYVWGTPWRYDPMPVLRAATTPQLWILGADDLEAPSAETGRRLEALAVAGRPYTVAVFPRAEHGIYEYELDTDGQRVSTRNPDGYLAMMRDFIRDGRLAGAYGDSRITRPAP
jgi:pimeloyl-ACP methyl ester carboxylesterase